MARIDHASIDIPNHIVSRNSTGSGRSTTSSQSRGYLSNNTIAEQVINSPAYKSALQVLSQESDKSWLQRLEMIPYSVSDANETFLDNIGLSNKYEDKQDANYQYCLEQIQALMAEYQSWKNSLPTNQVQQLSDAGINSAITGQGVSGSSIPNVGVSSNPSTLESTNVGDFFNTIVDKFLNLSSGTLDWISKFNEISLNNRRLSYDQDFSFASFVSELAKDGIIVPANIKSFEDLLNSDSFNWYDSSNARAKRLYNQFMEIRNMDSYGPTIVQRTLNKTFSNPNIFQKQSGVDAPNFFGSVDGAYIDISEYSRNIADLQWKLWFKDLEYRAKYADEKKKWHDENGYTNAEDIELFESETSASNKLIRSLEKDKMTIYVDYLKRLKEESDNGNLSSRLQLMDALFELNSTSQIVDFGDDLWSALKSLF